MVKACSRPRTALALAAKVEVVRKSLAERRAGSSPASGTNLEAAPVSSGAASFHFQNEERTAVGCAFEVAANGAVHRQPGHGGMALLTRPFLNPRSPAMNASSMCGISVTASTASP